MYPNNAFVVETKMSYFEQVRLRITLLYMAYEGRRRRIFNMQTIEYIAV
jgi:hypothetical protein